MKTPQHFEIIQSLCRSIINYDEEIAKHQVNRLSDAYKKDGFEKEAKVLKVMLKKNNRREEFLPQQLSISTVQGEELHSNTPIPVDKESSSPILDITFPYQMELKEPMFDENIRNAVNSVIAEWTHYDLLTKMKANPSRSCLIYGMPGTGKTLLARWLSAQVELPIVTARLDGIVSSFLGTSSRNISNLFSFANRYKCVLLLDEFDAIAKLRDDPQEVGEVKRIVNTLLQCLDTRSSVGFTIGVTNHEKLLDPAIWRRFDVQINIPNPSEEIRQQLLKNFLNPITLSDPTIRFLSWCLQGATGADIENFSNWFKRVKILKNQHELNIVNIMRQYMLLNTGRICDEVKSALLLSNDRLSIELTRPELNLKQKDVAAFLSITPSSLSKQIAKHKK